MFTGIVEELGTIVSIDSGADGARLTVAGPVVTADARHGDSIAVSGVCLTVVEVVEDRFSVDVVAETLRRSALGELATGDRVNLERAMALGDRLGGHIVQGHVDGTGRVLGADSGGLTRFELPSALSRYLGTYVQLTWPIVTVMSVLAIAYVMNASGQTATLGNWLAATGGLFALLSPILGWLGVAVTGSDTSANSLFGALQVTAANKAGLDPVLMAAANSSGGVLGKMVSPQNLAIAAGAVGMAGREGDIFRRVLPWSLLFLLVMCALVFLQSTPVLSWTVV